MGTSPADLEKIKRETTREINRVTDDLQTILDLYKDAAISAMQQITDERLNLIEKTLGGKPKYGLSDFFVDLMIATASHVFFLVLITLEIEINPNHELASGIRLYHVGWHGSSAIDEAH